MDGVTARIALLPARQRVALVAAVLWPTYFLLTSLVDRKFDLADTKQILSPAVGWGAALIYTGMRQSPRSVWLLAPLAVSAEVLVPQQVPRPLPLLFLVCAAHAIEMALGAAVLLRLNQRYSLEKMPLALIVAVGVSAAAGAAVGAAMMSAATSLGWPGHWWQVSMTWWALDALGMLVMLPLALTLCMNAWDDARHVTSEGLLALLALAGVCALLLGGPAYAYTFPGVFVSVWIALRFGVGPTALTVIVYATFVSTLTGWEEGPFVGRVSIYWARGFVFSYAVCVLAIAVIASQRRAALRDALAAHEQLRAMTDHDPMTGLATRRLLEELLDARLLQAASRGGQTALLALDLDEFANVNSLHGRACADDALVEIARRLTAQLPKAACVARIGGDEFAVLLSEVGGIHLLEEIANQLRHLVAVPVMCKEMPVNVTTSIGVAVTGDGTADQLLRDVEAALHEAKSQGRNRIVVRTPEHRIVGEVEQELINRVPRAIADREFALVYQPVLPCNGFGHGVEALARWRHGSRGVLRPDQFLQPLQRAGLMPMVGDHILDTVLRQVNIWRAGDAAAAPAWVSVNMSPAELVGTSIVRRVRAALSAAGVPASMLVLEVTEDAMIGTSGEVRGMLSDLRALGVRIAVDDFGTGFSGLAYLTHLPIDIVKLDRQFLHAAAEPRANQLLMSVASLAKDLGLTVIIEGVETTADLERARHAGADAVQGWLLGTPQEASAMQWGWPAQAGLASFTTPATPLVHDAAGSGEGGI